jgi:hypothetical protein
MRINDSAPWHKISYDRFVNDSLPQLLASRLPVSGYSVDQSNTYTCRIKLTLTDGGGDITLDYVIPQPDANGIFNLNDFSGGDLWTKIVVPIASTEDVDTAEIRCVGEQLYDFTGKRLAEAPEGMQWDEDITRKLVPIDAWTLEFMEKQAEFLDRKNWLAIHTHMRRIVISRREKPIAPGQFGRVCPYETPEGPNVGRIFSLAQGAEIRDGKIVVVDESAEAGLGLSASMVPFLGHNNPIHSLMGVNMMREWMPPLQPEPALVQTGNEPDVDGFWCGANLLTAFVSWGAETYEDGILVSESCAERFCNPLRDSMGYEWPVGRVEPGNKISNRHGAKGVISRIVPDDEMPHLSDGTPVELVFSFSGIHKRLNFGQVREALMSRIAKAEGEPAIVPPYHAPTEDQLQERSRKACLPEDGMEILTLGKEGPKLDRPSMVGWVYWGRTWHWARGKMHTYDGPRGSQIQGEMEYLMLRDIGAYETIAETFNTRSVRRDCADQLPACLAVGPISQAPPPTPGFIELAKRLNAAGIRAELDGGRLIFQFAPPDGEKLELARPVPHPWLREKMMTHIGLFDGQVNRGFPIIDVADRALPSQPEYGLTSSEWKALVQVNERLKRMLSVGAPESLTEKASVDLEDKVTGFLDALLTRQDLLLTERVLFSARTVLAPAADLRLDQVGLADEIAWALFGPLVTRELGDPREMEQRTANAAATLDQIMARTWVIINRAPSIMPTSLLAFHSVRTPDPVIRLHPLVCMLMNGDFDGDQAAVFLPITEEGQREAGELLSVAGHLRRDPELIKWLYPNNEMLWGLAQLSRTREGLGEISRLAGVEVAAPAGFVTRESITTALRAVLERDGVEWALEAAERLMRRGFEVAKESGASISPFIGSGLEYPAQPATDTPESWAAYAEDLADIIASCSDYDSKDLGPQLLAVKSGARGDIRRLVRLLGPQGMAEDLSGKLMAVRRGYRDGLTPDELRVRIIEAREGLGRTAREYAEMGYGPRELARSNAFTVLARAMRAEKPGVVFARAAATGETDPLADIDSRLFVGLPARKRGVR